MTKVSKCNNTDCANNENDKCTLKEIELTFFLDSRQRCICSGEVLRE